MISSRLTIFFLSRFARRMFIAGGLLFSAAVATVPSQAQLSPAVQNQIAQIYAFKKTFTPAEKKMSSNLVLLSREAQHIPLGTLAQFIDRGKGLDGKGRLQVEVGGELTPSLMSSPVMRSLIQDNGGDVPQYAYVHRRLGLMVHPTQLAELAAHPDVKFLSDADRPVTNVGSVTSQGYVTEQANKVVSLGYNGSGVTVGVMSDSATPARVAALIASGDLPANTMVVTGQSGPSNGTDEGAAMMEIVHDMAPGANLVFATADSTQAQFASNILALRFTYHCDIIVDDVTYFAEGVFQDGTVAQAVNAVTADGALYFSAAANSGNLTSGTSGTWEGDFTDGGPVTGLVATDGETGEVHVFSPGKTFDTMNSIGSGVSLKWSDPLGAANDDYDLFVVNAAGTVLRGFSAAAQTGTQDPFEFISSTSSWVAGDRVVVVLFNGAKKALHVDTLRGTLSVGTTGSTSGHNAGASTFTMAATYWNSGRAGTVAFKGGAANPVETFSSDGPRKIFFNPDGSELTAGNDLFSTNGGVTLQKPDATASDGVNAKTPGFLPFFGTSAAAPHAAGIAALVKSANPALTNVQIRAILDATALDNMAPGVDRDSGYGILMALPAVQSALTFPTAQ
jgi:subtilisin family serine protease